MTNISNDFLQVFYLESAKLHGRMTRLGAEVTKILCGHEYPIQVNQLLAEMLTLAAVLSANLKFQGILTLQLKSGGPVTGMVADVTSQGQMRGYARFDADKVAQLSEQVDLLQLTGQGYLVFTLDQGEYSDLYQGVVDLRGASLSEAMEYYWLQSEQFQAAVRIAAARTKVDGATSWQAGAVMINALPGITEDEWETCLALLNTTTSGELLDTQLKSEDLLFRLYHEQGVRVLQPSSLHAQCRCSEKRLKELLQTFPSHDLKDMAQEGKVTATCEFCGHNYIFDQSTLKSV